MDNKLEIKNKLDISNKVFTKNRKEPKKTKIKILCNHSVNNKNLYFTNFLERKDLSNNINTQVFKILKADGKELSSDEIPWDIANENDCLKHNKDNDRIPSILDLYNIEFEEEAILKCYGKSCLGHKIAGIGIPNDLVRIFVKQEIGEDEWLVVLIDPYHLVATESYRENYENYKNNQIDFNRLESPY